MLIGCSRATYIGGFAVAACHRMAQFLALNPSQADSCMVFLLLLESVSRNGPIDHARIEVGLFGFDPPKERLLSHAQHLSCKVDISTFISHPPNRTTLPLCSDAQVIRSITVRGRCGSSQRRGVHKSLKGASLDVTQKKSLQEKCGKGGLCFMGSSCDVLLGFSAVTWISNY